MSFEIEVVCDMCYNSLDTELGENIAGAAVIEVQLCEICMQKAFDRGILEGQRRSKTIHGESS